MGRSTGGLLAAALNSREQPSPRNRVESGHASAQKRQRLREVRFGEVADPSVKQLQQRFVLQEHCRSATQKAFEEGSGFLWLARTGVAGKLRGDSVRFP